MAGPHDVQSARGREEAFLQRRPSTATPTPPVARGAFTPSGGADAAERLLRRASRADRRVHELARAGDRAAARRPRPRPPRARATSRSIAYDELPVAEYLSPPLTTVAMPLSELGAAAVEILVEMLDGRPARSQVLGSEPVLVGARLHRRPVTIRGRSRARLRDTLQPKHLLEENRPR